MRWQILAQQSDRCIWCQLSSVNCHDTHVARNVRHEAGVIFHWDWRTRRKQPHPCFGDTVSCHLVAWGAAGKYSEGYHVQDMLLLALMDAWQDTVCNRYSLNQMRMVPRNPSEAQARFPSDLQHDCGRLCSITVCLALPASARCTSIHVTTLVLLAQASRDVALVRRMLRQACTDEVCSACLCSDVVHVITLFSHVVPSRCHFMADPVSPA